MKDTDKIFNILTSVFSEPGCYHNKWIIDESLARIVLIRYTLLNNINEDRVKPVMRLYNDAGAFGDSNTRGMYIELNSKSMSVMMARNDCAECIQRVHLLPYSPSEL